MSIRKEERRRKIAWGITGSGDKLAETIDIMREIKKQYEGKVNINVYLSKAAEQVLKYYKLIGTLKESFDRIWIEINSNSPFLAGQLQTGKFEFLLIAPATSNTVAKISVGIADSLLSNAAIMALKGFVSVYVMPTDCREGTITTKLPDERDFKLQIRREDVENVERIARMQNIHVLEKPENISSVFRKHFG